MTATIAVSSPPRIPLPQACARLGLTWSQGWRAVLTRQLDGEQVGNRWHVTVSSVEDLERRLKIAESIA